MSHTRAELWRKALHIGFGVCALLLRVLTPGQAALAACIALGFNLFVLDRVTRRALLRPQEIARGYSFGIALYPAAVLGLIIVFRDRLELAAATWGLLAIGDGMAGVVGGTLGGPKLSWNPAKTWAGFAAFVLWGTAAAAFLLRFTQQGALDAPKTWIGPSFLAVGSVGPHFAPTFLLVGCFVAATLAAFAESLPTKLDDNFLVPLVGGAALYAATLVEPLLHAATQVTRAMTARRTRQPWRSPAAGERVSGRHRLPAPKGQNCRSVLLDEGERMGHSDDVHEPQRSLAARSVATRRVSTWPRKRLVFLCVAVIACVVHGYVAIVFNNGPAPTPVRAWIVNGVLVGVVGLAISMLIAIWSRRWACAIAVVGVGVVAVQTAFFVHIYRRLNG
jgi:dolichol kinase